MTAKALVTLTFDDALDSHLDEALPRLDRAGLRGTFFVNVNAASVGRRADPWRAAAARGHELGNHSLLHAGLARKPWAQPGCTLEDYTLERMRTELAVANNVLRALDGRDRRSFAFPCSEPTLGRPGAVRRALRALKLDRTRVAAWAKAWHFDPGSTRTDYTPVVRELFAAARCGSTPEPLPAAALPDRYRVPALVGDGRSEEELLHLVDEAIRREAWAVFVFHAVGEAHPRGCSVSAFEALVERLAADERVAVRAFLEAADRLWP